MDILRLKDSARGRWLDIFVQSGINPDALSGRHGLCPKCGGTDRFRVADIEHGWLFCNQCHHADSGDGIASIQWWLGCDFKSACKFVAEKIGYVENGTKKRKSLKDRIEIHGSINESLAGFFVANNDGVSYLGLSRIGALNATHTSQHVAAFPCFGEDPKTLSNYVVMSLFGREVQLVDKDGNPTSSVRKKTLDKGAALMGSESLPMLSTPGLVEVCWKTEGPSDLAALLSIIPEERFACGEHVAVCNVHGAGEKPGWMAQKLASSAKVVHIIHDADKPGQIGAAKWADAIARAGGAVKIVQLPYEVEESHGKDLRDFIVENGEHAFGRLLSLAADVTLSESSPPGQTPEHIHAEVQMVLDRLGIDLLGELDSGEVLVYATGTKKMTRIRDIGRMQRATVVQAAGYAADNAIAESGEDSADKLKIGDVRTAMALAVSKRRIDGADFELSGAGIWSSGDKIVLCNRRHLSIWDGTELVKQESPRVDGMIFELGKVDWYNHEELERVLPRAADPEWCDSVWQQVAGYFDRWTWSDQAMAPGLLAALVGCTISQSIWKWRPQVAITGASNTGKSALFEFLFGANGSLGLFGPLAKTFALSTEAGLRQTIGRNSFAICIDEWDSLKGQRQRDILNLLRTAGPASTVRLGTTHHHAREFGLRHVTWLAGVHCGMDSEIDANRFLWFELMRPPADRYRAWKSPTASERNRSFLDLLAICVVHGLKARRLAVEAFQRIEASGVHQRTIECLATAGAMLAASSGLGVEAIEVLARNWCKSIQQENYQEIDTDEIRMIEDLLSLTVEKGGLQKVTVAEIVYKADYADSEYRKQLESQLGIAIAWRGDLKFLAVKTSKVAKLLGMDSAKSVSQVMSRLEGTRASDRVVIAGSRARVAMIPWAHVEKICSENAGQLDTF